MRYRFILEDDDVDIDQPVGVQCAGRHIEHVIIGEQTWDELLPHIETWLRGCGYIFDGELTVMDSQ
jgi:hypothetical protein